MRLFVAIDVPLQVQERIRELQRRVSCSLVRPSQCHCTLKFLGEISDPAHITRELSLIKHPSFVWTLDTVGGFPSLPRPRVLFVEGPRNPALNSLAGKVDDATKEVKLDKPFRAHVTFARCKAPVEVPQLKIEPISFTVSEFVLYQSILRSEGPEYKLVKRFPLT